MNKLIHRLLKQTTWTKDEVKLLLENGAVFKHKYENRFLIYDTDYYPPYRYMHNGISERIKSAWGMNMYIENKEIFKDKLVSWLK